VKAEVARRVAEEGPITWDLAVLDTFERVPFLSKRLAEPDFARRLFETLCGREWLCTQSSEGGYDNGQPLVLFVKKMAKLSGLPEDEFTALVERRRMDLEIVRLLREAGWAYDTDLDLDWEHKDAHDALKGDALNAETINDRAKLIMHRLIARRLSTDPDLLAKAKADIQDALERARQGEKVYHHIYEWAALLDGPLDMLRRQLTSRRETMYRLRLSSPFAVHAGLTEPSLRRRIWGKAKSGAPKAS
jgi:hypothetical protein